MWRMAMCGHFLKLLAHTHANQEILLPFSNKVQVLNSHKPEYLLTTGCGLDDLDVVMDQNVSMHQELVND